MEAFSTIVERHVISHRPPEGRVHTCVAGVPNPAIPQATHDRVDRLEDHVAGPLLRGGLGLSGLGFVAALLGSVMGWGWDHNGIFNGYEIVTGTAMMGGPVGAAFAGGTILLSNRLGRGYRGVPMSLEVPLDVARAYRAFTQAPALLRESGACETVIALVENLRPDMEAMVVELSRLTSRDAVHTEIGSALRDRVVHLSAQAQALVEMDQARTQLADLAVDTTEAEVLLSLPTARLDPAAEVILGETERLQQVLEAGGADHVIPASLALGYEAT